MVNFTITGKFCIFLHQSMTYNNTLTIILVVCEKSICFLSFLHSTVVTGGLASVGHSILPSIPFGRYVFRGILSTYGRSVGERKRKMYAKRRQRPIVMLQVFVSCKYPDTLIYLEPRIIIYLQ